MVRIRPNVSHAFSVVSIDKVYWSIVKWIFRCLQDAPNVGSIFDRDIGIGFSVIGYVDSNYAGDLVVTWGDITLKKIVTKENPVNIWTNLVSILKFKSCLNLIVVCSL